MSKASQLRSSRPWCTLKRASRNLRSARPCWTQCARQLQSIAAYRLVLRATATRLCVYVCVCVRACVRARVLNHVQLTATTVPECSQAIDPTDDAFMGTQPELPRASAPTALKAKLLPFQEKGFGWMAKQELSEYRGGIL